MQGNHPRLALGVSIERSNDSVLVHDPRSAKVHVLNATAGFILERCDGSRSLDDIASELEPLAESAGVRADVQRIVDEFAQLGLVEVESAAQP